MDFSKSISDFTNKWEHIIVNKQMVAAAADDGCYYYDYYHYN